jgi:hypothetical protein
MYGKWNIPDYHTRIHELEMRNKNFENITKLIEKSPCLKIKSREFSPPQCILEFEDPKTAILFALNFENYFPMNDELVRITYDVSYVCGVRSLAETADNLKNRRIVYLIDVDRVPSLHAPLGVPWGLKERRTAIENHVKQIIASAVEKGINPKELIVCYTSGWGREDLYGALGGLSLREKGYIVFPEGILGYPFIDLAGVPDLIAVKLGAFQDKLIEEGIIEYGGIIPEFEMLGIFGRCTRRGKVEEEKAVVVEVESSKPRASGGHKQLDAYVSTGHFDFGVLVCPGRADDQKYYPEYGYITWGDENEEISYFPEKSYRKEEKLSELLITAKKLISLTLIKNWTTEKLLKVYGNKSMFETIDAFTKSPKFID